MINTSLNDLSFECKNIDRRCYIEVEVNNSNLPSICPHCIKSILPITLDSYITKQSHGIIHTIFSCPHCLELFIALYRYNPILLESNDYLELNTPPIKVIPSQCFQDKAFSNEINSISPRFVDIYNQSVQAHNLRLLDIAGPGYRKALEFLIKDYLIYLTPNQGELIQTTSLGKCAKKLENDTINKFFEKLVWLGNDQVHYLIKHDQFSLNELKTLIDASVTWIDAQIKMKNLDQSLS